VLVFTCFFFVLADVIFLQILIGSSCWHTSMLIWLEKFVLI